MQINKVTFVGKGGVGLLYGSMIAKALGNDAVEYIMDDARFERHANDALTVNGKHCALKSIRASEATPADLVILTVKTTGLDQAIQTMEHIVGPNTLIASLCNGITSEQKIAERFGWKHTVLGICQGMDAVLLDGALTFTNAGEIRFGAAAGTEPSTVTFLEKREPESSNDRTAPLSMSERPFIKVLLSAASLRSACTNVPCVITSSNLARTSKVALRSPSLCPGCRRWPLPLPTAESSVR